MNVKENIKGIRNILNRKMETTNIYDLVLFFRNTQEDQIALKILEEKVNFKHLIIYCEEHYRIGMNDTRFVFRDINANILNFINEIDFNNNYLILNTANEVSDMSSAKGNKIGDIFMFKCYTMDEIREFVTFFNINCAAEPSYGLPQDKLLLLEQYLRELYTFDPNEEPKKLNDEMMEIAKYLSKRIKPLYITSIEEIKRVQNYKL